MIHIQSLESEQIVSQIISDFFIQIHLLVSQITPFIPFAIYGLVGILLIYLIRHIVTLYVVIRQKTVFLELTPPAITDKSAYTTQQLISVLHSVGVQKSFIDRLLGRKHMFSFEIISTKEKGIRYLIRAKEEHAHVIERMIISYLPQVRVKLGTEYLSNKKNNTKIIEFTLKKHYAFPLINQNLLDQHDPVAYITGMMTKLQPGEIIALQLLISPTKTTEAAVITQKILRNEDVLLHLNAFRFPWYLKPFVLVVTVLIKILHIIGNEVSWSIAELASGSPTRQVTQNNSLQQKQNLLIASKLRPARVLSTFEQEAVTSIQEKINQSLFETSLRIYISVQDKQELQERVRGITSSFAPFSVPMYQSLYASYTLISPFSQMIRLFTFRKRLVSFFRNTSNMLLSVSEIADLYHFPYNETTKTENIVKAYSNYLPAPLSLKKGRSLQVVFGKNEYGGTTTAIGLTKEERETHMYIIGRTGSGKTTLMFSMAKQDIENGEGMAFIDPHGDVSEELLATIPEQRKNDLIYLSPVDLKYPMGINILELTPGLDEDEAELEKEVVTEGVISLFRKVFLSDETANPHRIEYILRNTIYTAFTIENATIFTVYDLLNDPPFRKKVIAQLTDKRLQTFWKNEIGKAGDYQVVKMVGGVTAKVGRFLFSPTASRILEQKKSTINFDEILDQGKILICNFSQGNLGEDTARLLGTTILTKIQQAALRRARLPKNKRRPFYLYVDEFQNFATLSFIKLLSEGRKYGLSVCIAEQSTSQQKDQTIVNNILANVTTVATFRSANPPDEELMLAQYAPYVIQGDIPNLPRYNFYIKISALEPEEPFSGETLFTPITKDEEKIQRLISASRKNYAIVYKREEQSQMNLMSKESVPTKETTQAKEKVTVKGGLPIKKK